MAEKFYKPFTIAGTANETTQASVGITSSAAERKRVTAVILYVAAHGGNLIEGFLGAERRFGIYDNNVAGDVASIGSQRDRFELGYELELGDTFQLRETCGGTACAIHGAYEYERV